MPARKPTALIDPKRAKVSTETREARESAEAAMTPSTPISKEPPSVLKGHKYASAVWVRLLELYLGVDGTIISAFDEDLLIKYCLGEEEIFELMTLRTEIKQLWTKHSAILAKLNPKPDQLKDYFKALEQANALLQRFQGIDARLDGKKKLLHSLAQSLYLTPRARSGATPTEKEPNQRDPFGEEFD